MAESFFATLECELTDRRVWKTHSEARLAIFTWIEAWHNPHRRHPSLGQISPITFERLNVQKKEQTRKNAETQKPTDPVNNSESAQLELSIDCNRQINLIKNTQEVKNL